MKKHLLIVLLSIGTSAVFAQTYKDKAAEIQKTVTADAGPEFAIKDVPAQYANESAVILAQSYKIQRTTSSKFRFFVIAASVSKVFLKISTLHERVKINDKAALDNYSSIEYQKKLDKSINFLYAKFKNTHETFIGAKIIKPNGKEITVDTGEEVLLKDNGKDQQGKLAIPGLQVGDILDYYVCANDLSEDMTKESYQDNDQIFMQVSEYPILNYSVDMQISKKLDIQSIAANGAKVLTEKPATKDDRFFTLKLQNLPKYEGQLWTSIYRQYPYIEFSASFSTNFGSLSRKRDQSTSRLAGMQEDFYKLFNEQYFSGFDEPEKRLKEYFDGKKGLKSAPLDSSMKVLYDIWKYDVFGSYVGVTADDATELNYRTANSKINSVRMSLLLTDMKINHELIMVSSRHTSALANAFNPNDYFVLIKIYNGNSPLYMSFYDAFTHFNEIPPQYQGEQGIAMRGTRKNAVKYEFVTAGTYLPVVPSDQNRIEQLITVNLPAANMQKLQIDRVVKQSGFLRHDDQKTLVSPGQVDAYITNRIKGDDLIKRLKNSPETKKLSDVIQAGMNKSVPQIKKDFSDEIKTEFDQEPQTLTNFKVINNGLDINKPVFEFSGSFSLDNLVKKAGNNYIVEAGKLAGTFLKLQDKERKRTADIYMPGARSFKYTININIPKGYKVKGIEELKKEKVNKTGSFSSVAVLNGSVLTITINRAYTNLFEKVADWPLVTELIDAASNFNDQKILLEKEG